MTDTATRLSGSHGPDRAFLHSPAPLDEWAQAQEGPTSAHWETEMSRSVRALWFAIYLSAASLQACSSFGPPAVSIPLPKDLDRFSQELDQLNKVPGNDLV